MHEIHADKDTYVPAYCELPLPMKSPLLLFLVFTTAVHAAPEGKLRYNRDIRPILSDYCFACHGPDKNHREADLRLDVREAAIEMKAILPGKPEASSILERIHSHDEDDVMPPPESKKTLTEAHKALLTEWIRQGAEYEPHWSYTPLVRPSLPQLHQVGTPGHPVDAFIQDALAKRNISPSPIASARTLLRRLSLDLIGLPPTPEEAAAFEQAFKTDPQAAVSTWTTRLMKSPHFGERWAAWWLDVARFADTVGFHGDQNQRIFPYRDYVINSFNSNKRFDQFTLEQLAGDLLPNPTTEQLVATGFNRLNMMTREGGAQPKEYLAKYQADRVRTVGGTWMGATLGCAECHDHKFDPYTARDFYSMSAFFADVKQFGVYASYGYTPVEELKGWSNEHPFPPEILVDSPYLKSRLGKLKSQMDALARQAIHDAPMAQLKPWVQQTRAALKTEKDLWFSPTLEATTVPSPPTKKGAQAQKGKKGDTSADSSSVSLTAEGHLRITAKMAQDTTITLKPDAGPIAAVKIELLPDSAHQGSIELAGAANGMVITPTFSHRPLGTDKEKSLPIFFADADHKEAVYAGTVEKTGVTAGWKTAAKQARTKQTSVWLLDEPVDLKKGETFTVRLPNHTAGCLQISIARIAPPSPLAENWSQALISALEKNDFNDAMLAQTWLLQSGQNLKVKALWKDLHAQMWECNQGKAWTQVTVPVKEPLTIRRLPRGNWMDETGEICPPAPPQFLTGPLPEGTRQSRVDLAKWLTSAENPLTARTFVNRLWKQFFGNGLSMAVDDLGAQGETPSHPELLDWLAAEFRDSGWDIQHLMRLIVSSHTYRQDSRTRPELKDLDPSNRLLAFQNPRRLEAEFVRDNALFAAGLLNLDIGGPSVKPYQPGGYYENLQFPSRDYVASTDDRQWRRGVYMHWQRTFLHPMLANFDAPARDECTATRNVSNTPQQALTLLNDPTFVEAARTLAESLIPGSDSERLETIFLRTLARSPKPTETQSLLGFLQSQREVFKASPEDAQKLLATGLRPIPPSHHSDLAAWTSLCRVVLNLHETITRY